MTQTLLSRQPETKDHSTPGGANWGLAARPGSFHLASYSRRKSLLGSWFERTHESVADSTKEINRRLLARLVTAWEGH
jgi:hypothetical protein